MVTPNKRSARAANLDRISFGGGGLPLESGRVGSGWRFEDVFGVSDRPDVFGSGNVVFAIAIGLAAGSDLRDRCATGAFPIGLADAS